jgi:hypothetical protein
VAAASDPIEVRVLHLQHYGGAERDQCRLVVQIGSQVVTYIIDISSEIALERWKLRKRGQ